MRDITLCHPHLQELAAQLIDSCNKEGLKIKIGETYRTVAEQEALYAQGRTQPGSIVTNARGDSYSSQHQWGIAFDFYRNDGKGAYNESGNFFGKVGAKAKSLGLGWGGDWVSIVDKPHIYLPDWGSTTGQLKQLFGSPEKFMKTWKQEKTGWIEDNIGWWYRHQDGSYTTNDWEKIEEKWYWFDGAGYAVRNAWKAGKDGKWYYLGRDNAMVTGCILAVNNEVFAFSQDGSMMTGQFKLQTNERGALTL